ncbi:MAG: hypothetical protein KDC87_16360 [Planctomycetes bacterium]|nr:hypothetical protein [Planctomycetota bacterium]MCB9870400.1 hypothetical protein [Planctomycetota bacterium]MCB9889391.1 hypothetical protein [Planctomycetota bacterium]
MSGPLLVVLGGDPLGERVLSPAPHTRKLLNLAKSHQGITIALSPRQLAVGWGNGAHRLFDGRAELERLLRGTHRDLIVIGRTDAIDSAIPARTFEFDLQDGMHRLPPAALLARPRRCVALIGCMCGDSIGEPAIHAGADRALATDCFVRPQFAFELAYSLAYALVAGGPCAGDAVAEALHLLRSRAGSLPDDGDPIATVLPFIRHYVALRGPDGGPHREGGTLGPMLIAG